MKDEEVNKVMGIIKRREDRELLNKVVDMLEHIHNDIENVKRNVAILEHKVNGLANLVEHASSLVIDKEVLESVVNPDPETYNVDELYSPIDEKDKREWEKIKNERFEFREYKE